MHVGQMIETSNGTLLDIVEIRWWSTDDGAVHGRMMRNGKWSPEKYLGTVRGIQEAAVSAVRLQ